MRILIVISSDLYIRNFMGTGAFSALEDHELYYLSTPLKHRAVLEQCHNYLGAIEVGPWRTRLYTELSNVLLMAYRHRSSTFRMKAETEFLLRDRLKFTALAAPGLRGLTIPAIMRLAGEHRQLKQILLDVKPDLVVAPSAVTDPLLIDLARLGKRLGIPTLYLINGWDNLSSKLVFPENPDFLGVWGDQSVEHARTIHGMDRERVFPIGTPTFDHYFRLSKDLVSSPYPFRYVLFAGGSVPFDEISALQALEEAIETHGISWLKIVYRPHPWRQPRTCFDVFEPARYRHVVMDEQVRASYVRTVQTKDYRGAKTFMPSLDYYPALLSHAELVISPLSTMIIESAICETPVLVIAYDDAVHRLAPHRRFQEEHFKGIETIKGFRICRNFTDLAKDFLELVQQRGRSDQAHAASPSMRQQIRHYLYHDDRTYAQRLRDVVNTIGAGPATCATADKEARRPHHLAGVP